MMIRLWVLIVAAVLSLSGHAETAADRWNLSDLYPTTAAWKLVL
jgi:hypothetical protein